MKVIHAEFLRKFPQEELKPFYLFVGPETYPLQAFFKMLVDRVDAVGIKRYNGQEHKPTDIVAGASVGLFGQFRVPVVFDAHKMRGFGKLLEIGFTKQRPLVGVFNPNLKKRQDPLAWLAKFTSWQQDFLEEMCYVVELPQLDDETFEKWVAKQLRSGGIKKFGLKAFKTLVYSLPRELWFAKNELDKVIAFLAGKDLTQWEEISPLISFQAEVLEYQMTDSFVSGDVNSAMAQMEKAMASGAKPEQALSSFSRGLAGMCWAKMGISSMVRPGWKAKIYQRIAKNLTVRDSLELLRACVSAEIMVRKGADARLAVYNLLLKNRR